MHKPALEVEECKSILGLSGFASGVTKLLRRTRLFLCAVLLQGRNDSLVRNWGVANTMPHGVESLSKSLMTVLFEEHFGI